MTAFLAICLLTSFIALASMVWAGRSVLERCALPWTAGILLGISIFWILPEMAQGRGWIPTLVSVFGISLVLGLVDRRVCPICPFCAYEMQPKGVARACAVGWPLLLFACIHSFFDGWTIALSAAPSRASVAPALSWAATVHKLPESVAIGVLAVRLTSDRRVALGAVLLIQAVMTAGGVLSVRAGNIDARWAELSALPACAILLLFGLLTLYQEWQVNGRKSAIRAAAPGVLGSGLTALVTNILVR
jgi:zinc transporter ZupT